MIKNIKTIYKGYSYIEYSIEGENLSNEEVYNIREIREDSPFGCDISVTDEGRRASATCYID